MITLAWYLLKVIICSGILCGYYFLALRNKAFHRWNRFYLLASIVLALLVPLLKINIFQNGDADKGTVIQMLQTINYGDEVVIEYSRNGFHINSEMLAESAYLLISAIFLTIFFTALYKIRRLRKKYPETQIEGISFITTDAKGTPFSFFNAIFWNNAIDLHSKPGQQIFNHEIAHVKEKHSYDKIFMNVVLIFFWINPFFWLIRKELNMIHEFIADKIALEDSDINSFAEMILQTVYPGQNFSITNNFFYSPLKRRLIMLTKNKNPKVNYLSRLLVLPLAAIVFFAFTLKVKTVSDIMAYDGKTIIVVIDAGHGGDDRGAISSSGLAEKDITLSIVKKIAALNSNDHIKILLSRDNDQFISVKDRVEYAKTNRANMFISFHLNAAPINEKGYKNGISVLIDKKNKNMLLASALINELKKSYKTEDKIGTRVNGGIWVLDENICPAALVECGYITNPADEAFIINNINQEKVAKNVLDAIEKFAVNLNNSDSKNGVIINSSEPNTSRDTVPDMYYNNKKVSGIEMNQSKVKVTYGDGSKETITKAEAKKRGFVFPPPPAPPLPPVPPVPPTPPLPPNALYVVDRKIVTKTEVKRIKPENIESINVLKGEQAIAKYGEKGRKGVIEIITKNGDEGVLATADTIIIQNALSNSISDNFSATGNVIFINSKIPSGTLIFADGKEISKDEMKNISQNNIQSINVLKGESAEKKYGDKGKDGAIELTTKSKSKNDTIPNKIFTKVENEASFPGGKTAWIKYITKAIMATQDSLTEADYGTCLVKFIVNTDGSASFVKATTMDGTKLAEISVKAIRNGPKWIPATQNGHTVASYRLQPVTLLDPDKK